MSTQLEYDTADYAIASLARATGDAADYEKFATQAQNWQNVFNVSTGYLQARQSAGQWLPDFSPATLSGFVEGTSAQYTPMVPFNIRALITARGGDAAWVSYLNGLLSDITSPGPDNADLSDEPSLEIPYEYDYAGRALPDPADRPGDRAGSVLRRARRPARQRRPGHDERRLRLG